MKKNFKYLTSASLILMMFYIMFSGCKKPDSRPVDLGNLVFTGIGTAAQVIPVSKSPGSANFKAVYDANQKEFNYTITWQGLDSTVTSGSIYGPNSAGQNNVILRSLFTSGTLPHTDSLTSVFYGLNALSDSELAGLKNGQWYYVLNTSSSPNGAVRGQIVYTKTFFETP
jgi:hypothetical protein